MSSEPAVIRTGGIGGSATDVAMNAEMRRVDQPRLKQRYPYLKQRHFLMETLCPTFNCKFAGGISANAHRCHAAADRTRENDSARHGLSHMRQNGLRYAHQAKQIHLKNSFDLADIEIFEKSTKTDTDELNEGINTAGCRKHRIDRRSNLVFPGDVKLQNLERYIPGASFRGKSHLFRLVANGTEDTVPSGGQVQ